MGRNEGKNEKCISQSLHHLFIKKINENHKKKTQSWTGSPGSSVRLTG